MRSTFVLLAFCALLVTAVYAHADGVETKLFSWIKADAGPKVVLFVDNMDNAAVAMLRDIASERADLRFYVVDASDPANAADVKEANFTAYPLLFTASPGAGITRHDGAMVPDEILGHIHVMFDPEPSDEHVYKAGDRDELRNWIDESGKPTFYKFYEEWCPHCKAMRGAFVFLSAEWHDRVNLVEVQCSKNEQTQRLCRKHGVSGYPTLLFEDMKDKTERYEGSRSFSAMAKYLQSKTAAPQEASRTVEVHTEQPVRTEETHEHEL